MKFIYTNYMTMMLLLVQATYPKSTSGNFEPNSFDTGIDPASIEFDEGPEFYGNPKDINRRDVNTRYEREDNDNDNGNSNKDSNEDNSQAPRCAVMFKNNEPVGILQPFEDSYKFLPVSGEPTMVDINPVQVQKKSIMDVLYPAGNVEDYYDDLLEDRSPDEKIGYTDDKYPSIFAKFKIESRLAKSVQNNEKSVQKRNSDHDDRFGSLKATLSKIKTDDSVEVEEELRNILDDMGLIEDYPQEKEKRQAELEDENLESGTNTINLIAAEGDGISRNKREYTTTSPNKNLLVENSPPSLKVKRAEDYEKRFRREIRDKIEKLKEEVRKEIEDLKTVKDKNKSGNDDEDAKRKKRQVNTLMDEETKEIDPNGNDDEDQRVGHVRIKRDTGGRKRRKREVAEVLQQFNEVDKLETPGEYEEYQQNEQAQEGETSNNNNLPDGQSTFLNWEDPHCNCDKKGSNCKCSKQFEDQSPKTLRKKSSQTNCNCSNGHCVCEDVKEEAQSTEKNTKRAAKERRFENGKYYVDLHPDVYKLTAAQEQRDKRSGSGTFQELLATNKDHLVAIRQRSMVPLTRSRRRVQKESNSEPRQLIDMSEEDLFGALPQSFEGELARYKRVKRTKENIT